MGAWSFGVWDNDDALDFASDVAESNGWDMIKEALAFETDDDGGIDAADATCALAAADILAAACGKAHADIPEEVAEWIDAIGKPPAPALVESARVAVRSILDKPDSELRALWEEAGPDIYAEWRTSVTDLLSRLA